MWPLALGSFVHGVSVKPGLWTHGLDYGLDCGLRFGLDFGLMLSSMTTISNNKLCWRPESQELAACKHVEVEYW